MEIPAHIHALRTEGERMVAAAAVADAGSAVPTCPDWAVRDLVRHTGGVHRWATGFVATGRTEPTGPGIDEVVGTGPADAELAGWLGQGCRDLVAALDGAPDDLRCWTFLAAPSPRAMWARRQAHETAIHRADADSASGALPQYAPDFAADGVDELITGFGQRRKYRPSPGHGGTLRVRTTDTGDAWYLTEEEGRIHAHRGTGEPAGPSDCVVSGPASGLYLFLWNRSGASEAGVAVSGDQAVLAAWQSSVRVRWD
jgi:uncharacterized protein (TIGR03083 family)